MLLSEGLGGKDGPQSHHGYCEDHNFFYQWHDQREFTPHPVGYHSHDDRAWPHFEGW